MPTVILEDFPTALYERLQQQARERNRSLSEEVAAVLEEVFARPEGVRVQAVDGGPRLPAPPALSEEISPPCGLPLPGEGEPIQAVREDVPLPAPLPDGLEE